MQKSRVPMATYCSFRVKSHNILLKEVKYCIIPLIPPHQLQLEHANYEAISQIFPRVLHNKVAWQAAAPYTDPWGMTSTPVNRVVC